MEFEWDPKKAKTNFRKLRVSFEEAVVVFSDTLSFTYDDEGHSQAERRYATLGISARGRVLVVAHSENNQRARSYTA